MKVHALVSAAVVLSTSFAQQPFVRIDSTRTQSLNAAAPSIAGGPQALVTGVVCGDDALARHNQVVPGGGSLFPLAFTEPVIPSGVDRIVCYSQVNGSARNQGVFLADAAGLHPLVMGCGGGGGSGNPGSNVGDASPIGGKFTGFFGGTPFAPATNVAGDALFVADVFGGAATRGLFLYRAATQTVVKVAALGDVLPTGATIAEIGPGSINANGVVVFVAAGALSNGDGHILRWENGVTTKVARVGDPSPSGGAYTFLASEYFGFADGTNIPTGPIPDINDAGNIVFRAVAGSVRGFVFAPNGGSPQWCIRAGDPTPSGGTHFDFWSAMINNADQIAFMGDIQTSSGFSAGWYVGKPGAWRKAVEFFDVIDGASCNGLAASRNPMSPLSGDGDLVFWASLQYAGVSRDALVLSRASGAVELIRKSSDATSIGGTVGAMDAWPSMNDAGQATLSCGTPGASGGVTSAHFLLTLCPVVQSYCTAGTTFDGCNALLSGAGVPSASTSSGFTLSASNLPGQRNGLFFYGGAVDGDHAVIGARAQAV